MSNLLKLSGVTLPGDGYPKLFDFVPLDLPVKDGLVGLFRFGYSIEKSRRNLVNDAQSLSVVGAPTINPVGAALNNANCFDSPLKSSANMTIISVARMIHVTSALAGAVLVSSQAQEGAIGRGDDLYIGGTATPERRVTLSAGHDTGVTGVSTDIPGSVVGEWNLFAGRVNSDGVVQTGFARANLPMVWGAETDVGTRSVSTTRGLRIGGAYYAHNGETEHALVAIFNQTLAREQIEEIRAYLRDVWGPAFGIDTL